MSSFFHSHLTLLCNLPSIICFHDCQLELQAKALLHCSGHVWAQISSTSYTNANMCVLLHVHRALKVRQWTRTVQKYIWLWFKNKKKNWCWSWQDINQRQEVTGNSYLRLASQGRWKKALLLHVCSLSSTQPYYVIRYMLHLQYLCIFRWMWTCDSPVLWE